MTATAQAAGWARPEAARRRLSLMLCIWLGCALFLTLAKAFTGWQPSDPDDYMRMLEVRDLLAGQSWYDVRQYRMGPPAGADMHWSRLVDLPILAVRLLFGLAMQPAAAETATMIAVPLLYLLGAQLLLAAIMRRLGLPPLTVLAGVALVLLFPLVTTNFSPFRVDHHTPQGIAALACAALLVRAPSPVAAWAAGGIAAVWLAISLEGLVPVAGLAAIYGLRYAAAGERSLPRFLAGLAVVAPVLSFATRPWDEFTGPTCDVLHIGHMAAFGAAALVAGLVPKLAWQRTVRSRLTALCLLPMVCLPVVLATMGSCAFQPLGRLDPVVRGWWFEFVLEGMPIWQQTISVAIMLIWTIVLAIGGWLVARRTARPERQDGWTMLALLALTACAYSVLVMRAALIAQLLCIPFAALLLQHFLPHARRVRSAAPRIMATVACLLLITPTGPRALAKPLDRLFVPDIRLGQASRFEEPGSCDYRKLAALPPALLFAPLDPGPEIVMQTPHSVVMSGYHRNASLMGEVIQAYGGDIRDAERRVRKTGAQFLLNCGASSDLAMYRTRRTDNLVTSRAEGRVPIWLEPVEGFERGPLRLYRVR